MNIYEFEKVKLGDFPGKLEFMCYLEDETLIYQSKEERQTQGCIEICMRVLELTKKSDYSRYQVHAFSLLLEELEKEPASLCLITTFTKAPFYQYHLFQNSKTGKPFGCTWGPDLQKTPTDIWHKIFFPDYLKEFT